MQGADIAFSPGLRWGSSLLPGEVITRELLMDQLAITYPHATLTPMTGATIKNVLEDVADNLFNPDPYLPGKAYQVAGWAPVAEEARSAPGLPPVWDLVETWLKAQGGRVKPRCINTPRLLGVAGNAGLAGWGAGCSAKPLHFSDASRP